MTEVKIFKNTDEGEDDFVYIKFEDGTSKLLTRVEAVNLVSLITFRLEGV